MKYKIAVIENKLFEPLYNNIGSDGFLIKTTEEKAADLLQSNQVEIALLTPTALARISKKGDWRIIPSTALATKGYAELLTLSFKQNLNSIDSIYFEDANYYLKSIIQLLLAEKFDIHTKISSDKVSKDEVDAYISCFAEQAGEFSIDISEEWFDAFEFPLPIAFWVTSGEIENADMIELTNSIKDKLLTNYETINENAERTKYQQRSGEIIWKWSEEIENALDKTMDLLFYHQIINDIPDTKILGRDYSDDD
ncbi:MAG TPA: hypothetical protein PLU67_03695 [Candidatus Kapabacteria bacterium]|jgi:hypothetical protein|nr:hypothetical protein [Candidatus Kapabacteria bacterium]